MSVVLTGGVLWRKVEEGEERDEDIEVEEKGYAAEMSRRRIPSLSRQALGIEERVQEPTRQVHFRKSLAPGLPAPSKSIVNPEGENGSES